MHARAAPPAHARHPPVASTTITTISSRRRDAVNPLTVRISPQSTSNRLTISGALAGRWRSGFAWGEGVDVLQEAVRLLAAWLQRQQRHAMSGQRQRFVHTAAHDLARFAAVPQRCEPALQSAEWLCGGSL